jgi:hypothetical protein
MSPVGVKRILRFRAAFLEGAFHASIFLLPNLSRGATGTFRAERNHRGALARESYFDFRSISNSGH